MSTPRILGGRYEVGELIGRGGMAEVHLGHDSRLGRQVAIKILRSDLARDQNFLARFRREAQSAASLNHPSIVAIFDSGEDSIVEPSGAEVPVPYIVMEYVQGETLRHFLDQQERFPEDRAITITQGVLSALAYSHEKGIVHRDIKPANVMLTKQGSVKVMDFGIARAVADTAATMTQTHAVVGTAQYLSPEQAQGQQVDHRSDLYSTGAMLFELITGRTPFIGDSPVAIAYQHVGEQAPAPSQFASGLSPEIDAVVLHALTKDREQRYQDADEFLRDLANIRERRPLSQGALRTAAANGIPVAGAAGLAGAAFGAGAAHGQDEEAETRQIDRVSGARTDRYGTVAGVGAGVGAGSAYGTTGSNPTVPPPPGSAPVGQGDPWRDDDRRRDEEKRTSPATYVVVTLLVLALLAGLGLLAKNMMDNNKDAEAAQVTVPTVVGLDANAAKDAITTAKLVSKAVEAPSEKPKGTVFKQTPRQGSSVPEGSTVTYSVSTGPQTVKVPDVTGKTAPEARDVLEATGLKVVRTVISHNDPAQPGGHVLYTDPAKGTSIGTGSDVTLHIASGKVVVPTNLVGQDVINVQATLQGLKLKVTTKYQPSDQPYNSVLAVDKAGQTVETGTEIVLTVAQQQQATVTETQAPPTSDTPTSDTPAPPSDTPSGQ